MITFSDPSTANLRTSSYRRIHIGEDLLPTFATLTNDDARERKAELHKPGTFIVVAIPSSFARLPEYCEDESPIQSTLPTPASSFSRFHDGQADRRRVRSPITLPDDPNTVILPVFEDVLRRLVSPITKTGSLPSLMSSAPRGADQELTNFPRHDESNTSKLDQARAGGRNAHLLQHYRSNISSRVIKVGCQEVEEDIFEVQARDFPPVSLQRSRII